MTQNERNAIEAERINHFIYNGKTAIDLWWDAVDALIRIKSMHDHGKLDDQDYVMCVKTYRNHVMNNMNFLMMCAVDGSDDTYIVNEQVTRCGDYRFSYQYPGGVGGTNNCSVCDEYDNVQYGICCTFDDADKTLENMVVSLNETIDDMMFTNNVIFMTICK